MKQIPKYTFERQRLFPGYDGRVCKVCPTVVRTEKYDFLTYGMLLLSGCDVVVGGYTAKREIGENTFGEPQPTEIFEVKENGIRTVFACASQYYSKHHKTWFCFGMSISYANDLESVTHGGIAIAEAKCIFCDCETGRYIGEPQVLPLPFEYISATPHSQVMEFDNGDILLTFHITPKDEIKSKALAVRYRYENGEFSIVAFGNLIEYQGARGVVEPSVARLGDKHYMTLRSDEQGLLSVSDDGLNYSEPQPWKWDDGSILENYNTMQRWIRHKDALYLIYTRRGANNDHVFRHRAPLFMARFDEENLCLVRDTEIGLVPELGARLGNFFVTDISDNEFWLLTAEWMQPAGCEKYGSDNSIWLVKIQFE